jgi:hypothetical protein
MEKGRVRLLTTLKCGKNVWEEGVELYPPLPPDILAEIQADTGTVEVLGPLKQEVISGVNMKTTQVIGNAKPRIRRL